MQKAGLPRVTRTLAAPLCCTRRPDCRLSECSEVGRGGASCAGLCPQPGQAALTPRPPCPASMPPSRRSDGNPSGRGGAKHEVKCRQIRFYSGNGWKPPGGQVKRRKRGYQKESPSPEGRAPVVSGGKGFGVRAGSSVYALRASDSCAGSGVRVRPCAPTSTATQSPSCTLPCSSSSARGSCSWRWMTRLSGRAP